MIPCVKCPDGKLTRTRRNGWLEQRFYSRLGRFPWKCLECGDRVLLRMRDDPEWMNRMHLVPRFRRTA